MEDLFCYHASKGLFWFRIFGIGLSFEDSTIKPKRFSEREGLNEVWYIGKWRIEYLPKMRY